jgi:hypothetical protein
VLIIIESIYIFNSHNKLLRTEKKREKKRNTKEERMIKEVKVHLLYTLNNTIINISKYRIPTVTLYVIMEFKRAIW